MIKLHMVVPIADLSLAHRFGQALVKDGHQLLAGTAEIPNEPIFG